MQCSLVLLDEQAAHGALLTCHNQQRIVLAMSAVDRPYIPEAHQPAHVGVP